MLIESIARKTLELKRHCVKKAIEKGDEIVVYLDLDLDKDVNRDALLVKEKPQDAIG